MRKALYVLIPLCLFIYTAAAQKFQDMERDTKFLSQVSLSKSLDAQPGYIGGMGALNEYLQKSIQYRPTDKPNGEIEPAYIGFIIEKDGTASHFTALRAASPQMEAEALRIVKGMGAWRPGMIKDKPVKVPFIVSVDFNRDSTDKADERVYSLTDTPPTFNPDVSAFYQFFNRNVRYPRYEMENNVGGKVMVTFVVEKNGSLSNLRYISAPSIALGQEVLKIIGIAPRWEPGTVNGVPVRTRMTMPFAFMMSEIK